jgi:hypothetical protein
LAMPYARHASAKRCRNPDCTPWFMPCQLGLTKATMLVLSYTYMRPFSVGKCCSRTIARLAEWMSQAGPNYQPRLRAAKSRANIAAKAIS